MLPTLRRSGPSYRLTPTRLYQELVLISGAMTPPGWMRWHGPGWWTVLHAEGAQLLV